MAPAVVEKVPAAQLEQLDEPEAAWKNPAPQLLQVEDSKAPVEYIPDAQLEQVEDAEAMLYVPEGQATHVVELVALLADDAFPSRQLEQLVDPGLAW